MEVSIKLQCRGILFYNEVSSEQDETLLLICYKENRFRSTAVQLHVLWVLMEELSPSLTKYVFSKLCAKDCLSHK